MTHYNRRQLLDLFKDSYPFPEGMQQLRGAFVKDAQTPQLFLNKTLKVDGNKKIGRDIDKQKKLNQNHIKRPAAQEIKLATKWYYLDPNLKIQGPFDASQLRGWWEKGMFPSNLKISQTQDLQSFRDAITVFGKPELVFAFNPSIFPFIVSALPPDPDNLQQLVFDFDINE